MSVGWPIGIHAGRVTLKRGMTFIRRCMITFPEH
nr:MAG TPA: hypothetical protein [Caudoviricetes sp.]